MLRYTSYSDFYFQKKQQEEAEVCQPVVNGSLAEEVNLEKCPIVCRAPSRTWWEQAWSMRRHL